MGRSFQSVRMGVKDIAGRWERAAMAMRSDDAAYAEKVVKMAKTYASEGFYAFDDPLEAAVFSVLICMCRDYGTREGDAVPRVNAVTTRKKPCHPGREHPGLKGDSGCERA